MDLWNEQKKAFRIFISNLEEYIKQWAKNKHIENISLEKAADVLIRLDRSLNLLQQESKLKELMTFISINMNKSLSVSIERNILRLKAEIEREQE